MIHELQINQKNVTTVFCDINPITAPRFVHCDKSSITRFKAPDLDIDEAATLEHEAAETAQDVPGGRARVDERRCKNGTVHQ